MVRGTLTQRLSLFLTAAVVLAAILAACGTKVAPRFPHLTHLTGMKCGGAGQDKCLSCADCHSPTQEGRLAKLPDAQMCGKCHQEEPRKMSRVLQSSPNRPHGEITFNHDKHLQMAQFQGQCIPCHAGVVQPGVASIPPMSQCLSCHEHEEQWQAGTCSPCHLREDLERTSPQTFLRHDQNFLRHHEVLGVTQEKLCKSCHTQSDCQTCHDLTTGLSMSQRAPEKILTNQVHRGDFLVRHALEARSQPARCASCHQPADCDSCHIERGVSDNARGAPNPHPIGWVGGNPNSRDSHGRAARRDLLSCAGCHEAGPATNCIGCHKVGAYGGNPHPSGWKSVREPSSTMCRYCHQGL